MEITRALIKKNILQLMRTPIRIISMIMVITLVCTFLCISMNLREIAKGNVSIINQEFDVVAIPTFKGSVNHEGTLTSDVSGDYQGYMTIPAFDFDVSQIEAAAGVKDVMVHRQFGIYLNQKERLLPGNASTQNMHDVFIFTYTGDEPMLIHREAGSSDAPVPQIVLEWSAREYDKYPIRVIDSGNRSDEGINFFNEVDTFMLNEHWTENITELNVENMWPVNEENIREGSFVLQPGQQYIACGEWAVVSYYDGSENYIKGSDELDWVSLKIDEGHSKRVLHFLSNDYFHGWYAIADPSEYHVTYPCIVPYTDDFWETEAGSYFQDAIDICRINGSTLTAVSTPDLSMYTPFYNGDVYISDGRSFTADDYANGNKVCIVSAYLAAMNDWQIGDKLDLSFFEATYGFSGEASDVTSYYEPLVETYNEETGKYELYAEDIMFDQGQYEIVGFFDGKVTRSPFMDDVQYDMEEGVDRQIVFIPENSVASLPDVPLSQYNTTILLDDEQVIQFMSNIEASGLMEQKKGQYEVTFEVFDQGLGAIKQSLRQLDTVSRLTLYLACAAAVVVIILLSVLTVLQNRRQIATLRSLGVRKRQIPAAVLSGMLLVCLLGAVAGGMLGHMLSDSVAEYILDTAQMDLADTSFSAMLAKDDVDEEEAYIIAIQSQPETAILAASSVWFTLSLLCCVLILPEAGKSPMLTLGTKE